MAVSLVESNIPSPTTAINESNIRPKKPHRTNAIRRCFKKPIPHALTLKGITKKRRTKCSASPCKSLVFNAGARVTKRGVSR
jgi:hypothetical protein